MKKITKRRKPEKRTTRAANDIGQKADVKSEPIKARHFRKTAKEEIEKSYKTILGALTHEASGGSIQHTKLLFDLGGVQEEVEAASKKRRRAAPSLGRILLKEAEALKRGQQKDNVKQG
ncbi:MAG TPA: hypothetical protein VHT24_02870 [Pseudacidobacterium sp.]|jgi:hypothetical protein|nr:hypothetical protein [Pseudacidobacterium sp.]